MPPTPGAMAGNPRLGEQPLAFPGSNLAQEGACSAQLRENRNEKKRNQSNVTHILASLMGLAGIGALVSVKYFKAASPPAGLIFPSLAWISIF